MDHVLYTVGVNDGKLWDSLHGRCMGVNGGIPILHNVLRYGRK